MYCIVVVLFFVLLSELIIVYKNSFCVVFQLMHYICHVLICELMFLVGRLTRYKNFKEGHKRILVATDLVGRGIDIERVNIVINYDMPDSADTYLHRVTLMCPAINFSEVEIFCVC